MGCVCVWGGGGGWWVGGGGGWKSALSAKCWWHKKEDAGVPAHALRFNLHCRSVLAELNLTEMVD